MRSLRNHVARDDVSRQWAFQLELPARTYAPAYNGKKGETIAMATLDRPSDTAGPVIAASKVNGRNVYDTAGNKLGSIYDIMLDKISGKTRYVIMSFGGFLRRGERYHPLPWAALKYDEMQGGYVVNLDRRRLEGAPTYNSYDPTQWGDQAWTARVDDYYGLSTHDDLRTGPMASDPGRGTMPRRS